MSTIFRAAALVGIVCVAVVAQTQVIRIKVDASKAPQRLFHASLTMPVNPGSLTLLYPQWIPGDHQPVGPISDLVGLKITGGGRPVPWTRDMVDMYAFHLEVPTGVTSLDIALDLIAAPEAIGVDSSTAATSELAIVNWYPLLLYPKGTPADRPNYQASLTVPDGWRYGTALPIDRESGATIDFKTASLTTLVDSPVLAGKYFQTLDLSPGGPVPHLAHLAGDSARAIETPSERRASYRNLVKEETALFGAGHYRGYHFLISLSDHMLPYAGLEHHESSDNRFIEKALQGDGSRRYIGDVLAHEMAHSWNGKYRRPVGLATQDYSEPMKGDLLWVYEGMTDYWGRVLAARSGLRTAEDFRDELAEFAARLSNQAGREWRPLVDTAIAAQNTFFARDDYADYRRGADYYNESTLIWLEADVLIRQLSHGSKSLDDFCKIFAAGPAGMPAVKPYTWDEVIATLAAVQPYDWEAFLTTRVRAIAPKAPLGGIEGAGWKLVYTSIKSDMWKFMEEYEKLSDFTPSIGIKVKEDSTIADVRITSAAYLAGIPPATKLIAVNDRQFTPDVLREAVQAAKGKSEPIELLVKNGEFYKTHRLDYHDGERYPHLEQDMSKPDLLAAIVKPLAK